MIFKTSVVVRVWGFGSEGESCDASVEHCEAKCSVIYPKVLYNHDPNYGSCWLNLPKIQDSHESSFLSLVYRHQAVLLVKW